MDKDLSRAGAWIKNAYALAVSQPVLWIEISILYLALVALVSGLPFVGDVLLVLWTPITIAGILKEALDPHPTKPLLRHAVNVFFGILRDRELVLPVMSAATILLGAWVFLSVIAMLFGVDSFSLVRLFAHRGLIADTFTAILLAIFWALQVGIVMTTLYVLAGIVLSTLKPTDALEQAVGLWRTHPLPIGALGGLLVLPLVLVSYCQPWVQALVTIATLVPLTLAVYISYNALRSE